MVKGDGKKEGWERVKEEGCARKKGKWVKKVH
jgi:hypothetical protein